MGLRSKDILSVLEDKTRDYQDKIALGTKDTFGQSGEQRQLMEFYGLTDKKIYDRIIEFMDVKW